MGDRYIKLLWPEYQDYMDYPGFRDLSGYDPEKDVYYVPEYIVEEVDYQRYPDEIEHEGEVFKTKIDYKRGDTVLMEGDDGKRWITTCKCKGDNTFPDIFENDNGTIPGINSYVIGVKVFTIIQKNTQESILA